MCICVSVTKLADTYTCTSFASPKGSFVKLVMVFQMHVLYEFAENALFSSFDVAKFLDFSQLAIA